MSLIKHYANGGPVIGWVRKSDPIDYTKFGPAASGRKGTQSKAKPAATEEYKYLPGDTGHMSKKQAQFEMGMQSVFSETGNLGNVMSHPMWGQINALMRNDAEERRHAQMRLDQSIAYEGRMQGATADIDPSRIKARYNAATGEWGVADEGLGIIRSKGGSVLPVPISKGDDVTRNAVNPRLQNGMVTYDAGEFDQNSYVRSSDAFDNYMDETYEGLGKTAHTATGSTHLTYEDSATELGKRLAFIWNTGAGHDNVEQLQAGVDQMLADAPNSTELTYAFSQDVLGSLYSANKEITIVNDAGKVKSVKVKPEDLYDENGDQITGAMTKFVNGAMRYRIYKDMNLRRDQQIGLTLPRKVGERDLFDLGAKKREEADRTFFRAFVGEKGKPGFKPQKSKRKADIYVSETDDQGKVIEGKHKQYGKIAGPFYELPFNDKAALFEERAYPLFYNRRLKDMAPYGVMVKSKKGSGSSQPVSFLGGEGQNLGNMVISRIGGMYQGVAPATKSGKYHDPMDAEGLEDGTMRWPTEKELEDMLGQKGGRGANVPWYMRVYVAVEEDEYNETFGKMNIISPYNETLTGDPIYRSQEDQASDFEVHRDEGRPERRTIGDIPYKSAGHYFEADDRIPALTTRSGYIEVLTESQWSPLMGQEFNKFRKGKATPLIINGANVYDKSFFGLGPAAVGVETGQGMFAWNKGNTVYGSWIDIPVTPELLKAMDLYGAQWASKLAEQGEIDEGYMGGYSGQTDEFEQSEDQVTDVVTIP